MADICWIWANKIDNWASAIKMCTGHFWVFITLFFSGNFRWNQLWITGTVGKNQVLNEVFPSNLQYQYSRQSSYSNPSFIFIWEIYPCCKIEEKKNNFVWYGLKAMKTHPCSATSKLFPQAATTTSLIHETFSSLLQVLCFGFQFWSGPDMRFVQNLTPPDFQKKNYTVNFT